VSLRFSEKQSFYHSLGQLLRSGVTFPAALKTLTPTARGSLRGLLKKLNHAVENGSSIGEAFAAQKPAISEMEIAIVSAVERAGKLDRGLAQLSAYFEGLAKARTDAMKRVAYPIFILHFGILVFPISLLMTQGVEAYLVAVVAKLAILWGAILALSLVVPAISELGAKSAFVDGLLRWVPLVSSIRRNFAVSRFCSTYEMQMGAGVNVMEGLEAAGRASRSGLIAANIARALPEVVKGNQVGPLLGRGNAFPPAMIRDFTVGEQTGRLDEELNRLTESYRTSALHTLEIAAEWVPRLIYLAAAAYVGVKIVLFYKGQYQQIDDLMKQM
jgi:type II secretory pathway component PulF